MEAVEESLVDAQAVLEYTTEARVEAVTELVLRGGGYTGFAPRTAARLAGCLEALSLSHNSLRSLASLSALESLTQLNLNFNQVASLDGLSCPNLRHLYLSNNALRTLEGIGRFPQLHTLCLFRNALPDLSQAVAQLKPLARLRELDLDGNPCAQKASYKHSLVKLLPRLSSIDGEHVTALDRELAGAFFGRAHARQQEQQLQRPSTAPAPGSAQFEKRMFNRGGLNDNALLLQYVAQDALAHPERSSAANAAQAQQRQLEQQQEARAAGVAGGSSSLFVGRLRRASQPAAPQPSLRGAVRPPVVLAARRPPSASSSSSDNDNDGSRSGSGSGSDNEDGVAESKASEYELRRVREEADQAALEEEEESRGSVLDDITDPQEAIRKLLRMVQDLQDEKEDLLKRGGGGGGLASSVNLQEVLGENDRLRVENANMFIMQQENQSLRQRLAALPENVEETGAENARLRAALEEERQSAQLLRTSNADLTKQVSRLERRLQRRADRAVVEGEAKLESGASSVSASPPSTASSAADLLAELGLSLGEGGGGGGGGGGEAAAGGEFSEDPADFLAEVAEMDPELADLFQRNATTLRQIRQDVRKTKKELRREREVAATGVVRPQTSAGFGDAELGPRPGTASSSFADAVAALSSSPTSSSSPRSQGPAPPEVPRQPGTPVRPYTAVGPRSSPRIGENLLGHSLASQADVAAAYDAAAEAQRQMAVLRQARGILESRDGRPRTSAGWDPSQGQSSAHSSGSGDEGSSSGSEGEGSEGEGSEGEGSEGEGSEGEEGFEGEGERKEHFYRTDEAEVLVIEEG